MVCLIVGLACLAIASDISLALTRSNSATSSAFISGEFHDQGGAKWIVIRSLWGHTPCGAASPQLAYRGVICGLGTIKFVMLMSIYCYLTLSP
jgi:hypothetical protein